MSAPSVTAATILIVDDEETNLYALRLILESKGYRCLEASSGAEAIQIATAATPEVVLLDIHMPDMDGYAVCRRLKADARTENIPIVFLTARYRDHDEIARGLDAGAHDYVTKPFSAPELLARIGVMVRIQRAEAEARRASLTDSLTGLYNRRFLHQRLEEEMARSRRHASPLACVMIDLDHFKAINDNHGHATGDAVLRDTATILRRHIRKSDIAVRYGGEEFMIVLFSNNLDGARLVAERIRADVEAHDFSQNATPLRVTISVGISTYPDETIASADELMRRADTALYQAKEAGRNMVCVA
ncbi:MAG: diguanylate cyclase [Acidobacteria bacterium]|nr:diguanylate cyclase [Acidobacteriota bacterium]